MTQNQNNVVPIAETVGTDVHTHSHHGLLLWPPPSDDPKDPLRWPRWTKVVAVLTVSLFNFVANFNGAGLSVATVILEMQFQKTASQINSLLTFNFLLLGVGNMIWVPLSVKFGKRPIMLVANALFFAVLVWTAKAKTFNQLLAARCVSGFASAAGESVVPGIVSDMFFLHERGAMMSIYVILIAGGSAVGPLIAGFMVQYTPDTWRDFTWLCSALAGLNLVLIFVFYPESSFTRPLDHSLLPHANSGAAVVANVKEGFGEASNVEDVLDSGRESYEPVPVSYISVWTSFITFNPLVNLTKAFFVPFMFLACTPVLWVILVYGTALASQIILIFAFPTFLLAPPYLFASSSIGLMQIAALIGFVIACFGGGYICDVITSKVIVRNGGVFVPEHRLISLIPGCWIAPVGCIIIAFACSEQLTWVAIAFGFGMVSFGTVYAPNIAITYVVDSYRIFSQEILVVVSVVKNLVAFLFLYVAVDWVQAKGYIQVYMIMFMAVTLSMIFAVPVYFFGRKARESFQSIILRVVKPVDA